MAENHRYVVVTTMRGVFAGVLVEDKSPGRVTLAEARCAVYWSRDVRGFGGLAAHGPTAGCRIGPAVPQQVLYEITSILDCTPGARTAWEKAPWSS